MNGFRHSNEGDREVHRGHRFPWRRFASWQVQTFAIAVVLCFLQTVVFLFQQWEKVSDTGNAIVWMNSTVIVSILNAIANQYGAISIVRQPYLAAFAISLIGLSPTIKNSRGCTSFMLCSTYMTEEDADLHTRRMYHPSLYSCGFVDWWTGLPNCKSPGGTKSQPFHRWSQWLCIRCCEGTEEVPLRAGRRHTDCVVPATPDTKWIQPLWDICVKIGR